MRLAFDTNIYAYAESVDDVRRANLSRALIRTHEKDDCWVPVQVLAELASVLLRKLSCSPVEADRRVARWASLHTPIPVSWQIISEALRLKKAHRIAYWDAIVLASAAEARCSILFSEDMQHGFVWRGVTVQNPFRV